MTKHRSKKFPSRTQTDDRQRCTKLRETTYFIDAFYGERPLEPDHDIANGSGVAINSHGFLLTAAHVVTGRLPIKVEDVADPTVKIVARRVENSEYLQYMPVTVGATFHAPYFSQPITIDLAILRPVEPQEGIPYLRISPTVPDIGSHVLMAGFPDDVEIPFGYNQLLKDVPEIVRYSINSIRLIMIKSGMIGCTTNIHLLDESQGIQAQGDIFYIDNAMHLGASGGPVINSASEIIGIITQRAITSVPYEQTPQLKVPSGSTVAISPKLFSYWIKEYLEYSF